MSVYCVMRNEECLRGVYSTCGLAIDAATAMAARLKFTQCCPEEWIWRNERGDELTIQVWRVDE